MTLHSFRFPLAACALFLPAATQAADPAPFDLPGPELAINVTRGDRSLPIGRVPALAAGDRLEIGANLPPGQSVKYLLVSAFLRGVTNPPPSRWIDSAETWEKKDKKRILSLTVPAGARQLVLFLMPDTGGGYGAVSDAVRGKPGEFVRVTQEINQVSLDRSRLEAFATGIRSQENGHPEYLRAVAPILSSSLAVKLNPDCLAKVVESQAACLLENREALVLGDIHSNSLTETIVGTPADLAMQISATREAGYGFYSPYIGVVRDIARIFGAFNSPDFGYLPALGLQKGPAVSLLLNQAPSFRKPKSVLVAAMPAIEKNAPPPLRKAGEGAVCAARPGALFAVEGAPLIYATDYAHDMALRLTAKNGQAVDTPVVARADRGGYVLSTPLPPAGFDAAATARLHGQWGFDPFEGPEFLVQFPQGGAWTADDQKPVVGRDNSLILKGDAPACVEGVTLQLPGGKTQPAKWEVAGPDGIAVTVPLTGVRAGDLQLAVKSHGVADASALSVRAYAEQSRLDGLLWHAGDPAAVLTGLRLDQVKGVAIDGVTFAPGTLSRDGDVDRLQLLADAPDKGLAVGRTAKAQIAFRDGRTAALSVTVAAPRPAATILARSIEDRQPASGPVIKLAGNDLLPDSGRMTLSLRAPEGASFGTQDVLEIATEVGGAPLRLSAANGLLLESRQTAIARFDAAALGPSAFGPVRFRLVQSGVAGNWQPLATLVRLPAIRALSCEGSGCTLSGQNLFLVEGMAVDADFTRGVTVPSGFTGGAIDLPASPDGQFFLRLRDAPETVQAVVLPAG